MHPKDMEASLIALGSEVFILVVVLFVVLAIFGGICNMAENHYGKRNRRR